MCRNIKTLFNFDPPVTEEEVRAASLQFVRKISGFTNPSKVNEEAFLAAVEEVAGISMRLLRSLETTAPPKNREEEAAKAKARAAKRFGACGANGDVWRARWHNMQWMPHPSRLLAKGGWQSDRTRGLGGRGSLVRSDCSRVAHLQ